MTIGDPRADASGKGIADADIKVAAKDPGKGHFYVSIVKSVIRLVACGMLIGVGGYIAWAGIALGIAEVLGIVEELVD